MVGQQWEGRSFHRDTVGQSEACLQTAVVQSG